MINADREILLPSLARQRIRVLVLKVSITHSLLTIIRIDHCDKIPLSQTSQIIVFIKMFQLDLVMMHSKDFLDPGGIDSKTYKLKEAVQFDTRRPVLPPQRLC